jgi:proteasome lid subunit RPN8/RPN11
MMETEFVGVSRKRPGQETASEQNSLAETIENGDSNGVRPIDPRRWLYEIVSRCQRALEPYSGKRTGAWWPPAELREMGSPAPRGYSRLARVKITTGVVQSLFEEYLAHRRSDRREEETGWVLLGWREEDEACIRATIPAGAGREAGEAHIRFSSTVQAAASRFIRQQDRRLTMVGVVHTHPGSLRHPSDGDYRGDIQWVGQLRGSEGIFGIGTADGLANVAPREVQQPRPNMLMHERLRFTWYALREGDRNYRPVSLTIVPGPDLASRLRVVWDILEDHATRIERLAFQQARAQFEVLPQGLALVMPLAEGPLLRTQMSKDGVRYFLQDGDDLRVADLAEPRIDCGIYQLLAQRAGQANT